MTPWWDRRGARRTTAYVGPVPHDGGRRGDTDSRPATAGCCPCSSRPPAGALTALAPRRGQSYGRPPCVGDCARRRAPRARERPAARAPRRPPRDLAQGRDLVPEALARRPRRSPLAATTTLDVATRTRRPRLDASARWASHAGRRVRLLSRAPSAIAAGPTALYRAPGRRRRRGHRAHRGRRGRPPRAARWSTSWTTLIGDGIAARASDVHLEPEEGGIAVRYRIDGVLRAVRTLPRAVGLPLVSASRSSREWTSPTAFARRMGVTRVAVGGAGVDSASRPSLGARRERWWCASSTSAPRCSRSTPWAAAGDAAALARLLAAREGWCSSTGPRGPGRPPRSTPRSVAPRTAASTCDGRDTVEIPAGRRACRCRPTRRPGSLRPALRSISGGPGRGARRRVRDRETARSRQAALTGHLVLSTLHTNDAVGAVTRLLDLGVDGAKAAGALKGDRAAPPAPALCRLPRAARVGADGPGRRVAAARRAAPTTRWEPECAFTGYRVRWRS